MIATVERKPTVVKIEDHEGSGECQSCGRTGLRWIVTLSDGSKVGTECAKKVMGWTPAPKSYAWVADYTPVAEHVIGAEHFIMWQHKHGNRTRMTINGVLYQDGGVRQDWIRKGWIVAGAARLKRTASRAARRAGSR